MLVPTFPKTVTTNKVQEANSEEKKKIKKTNHLLRERIDASEVTLLHNYVLELINLAIKDFLLRLEQARERRRRTGQGQLQLIFHCTLR